MTANQQRFLQHLREFGLIYQRKVSVIGFISLTLVTLFSIQRSSQRFYPTRLAVNLSKGSKGGDSGSLKEEGFIVVETNYRVYAYTSGVHFVAVLCNF
jgi:transcription initiation factor TFIIH subunit 4